MAYSLRLPEALDAEARARCERLGISLNALICVAIDAYLRGPPVPVGAVGGLDGGASPAGVVGGSPAPLPSTVQLPGPGLVSSPVGADSVPKPQQPTRHPPKGNQRRGGRRR